MKKSILIPVLLVAIFFLGFGCFGQSHARAATTNTPAIIGVEACCDGNAVSQSLTILSSSTLPSQGQPNGMLGIALFVTVWLWAGSFPLNASANSRGTWYQRINLIYSKLFPYFQRLFSSGIFNPKIF